MHTTHGRAMVCAITGAALVLALGLFCHQSLAGKSKFVPHTLTVVFTGDDMGNLKPCG